MTDFISVSHHFNKGVVFEEMADVISDYYTRLEIKMFW